MHRLSSTAYLALALALLVAAVLSMYPGLYLAAEIAQYTSSFTLVMLTWIAAPLVCMALAAVCLHRAEHLA